MLLILMNIIIVALWFFIYYYRNNERVNEFIKIRKIRTDCVVSFLIIIVFVTILGSFCWYLNNQDFINEYLAFNDEATQINKNCVFKQDFDKVLELNRNFDKMRISNKSLWCGLMIPNRIDLIEKIDISKLKVLYNFNTTITNTENDEVELSFVDYDNYNRALIGITDVSKDTVYVNIKEMFNKNIVVTVDEDTLVTIKSKNDIDYKLFWNYKKLNR